MIQIFFAATAIAYRRSDAFTVAIVEGVVLIVVVVIPVACPVASRMVPVVVWSEVTMMMVPWMEMMVVEWVIVTPAPAIIKAPVVISVVVGTHIIAWPPPIVA